MNHFVKKYFLSTKKEVEFIDITTEIKKSVLESKISEGHLLIQTLHTTTGIYLNEFEQRLIQYDLPSFLAKEYPKGMNLYRHDDIDKRFDCPEDEPLNGNSHLSSMFNSNPSLSLIVSEGKLQIGKYQRIIFAEFDGPCPRKHKSEREYLVSFLGD